MGKKEINLEKEQMLTVSLSLAHLLHLSRMIICICSLGLAVAWFHKHPVQSTRVTIFKDFNTLSRGMRLFIF